MTGQVEPVTLPRPSDFLVGLVLPRSEVEFPNRQIPAYLLQRLTMKSEALI